MKQCTDFVLTILLLSSLSSVSEGALSGILEQCCTFGTRWFSLSRGTCSRYPANVRDVSAADQMSCASVLQICCLAQRQNSNCETGKDFAKTRGTCDDLEHSHARNEDAKECCHCCKLGQVAQQERAPCSLFNRFSQQCGATFYECCGGGDGGDILPLTVDTPPPTQIATTPFPTEDTLAELDYCAKFGKDLCAHICVTTEGSFRCQCHEGFTLNPADSRTCLQSSSIPQPGAGRCVTNPCQHDCVDTGVAVHCKCWNGYMLQPDGRNCQDVDECAEGIFSCQPQQTCVNTDGSYSCVGPSSPNVENCATGYAWSSFTYTCEDIDECTINRHTCSEVEDCYNTPGSFECQLYDLSNEEGDEDVNTGTGTGTGTGGFGDGGGQFSCSDGFQFNTLTSSCEDVDECSTSAHNCYGVKEVCRNTFGSYKCDCDVGFEWNRSGSGTCTDVDECILGTHNCGNSRECENTQGSFRCSLKRCQLGYKLDQRSGRCVPVNCPRGMKPDRAGFCIDINECIETPSVCRSSQECRNTVGSHECRNLVSCGAGLELNGAGTGCQDVDECQRGTHECRDPLMKCINRPGTHICRCPDGYQVDHVSKTCEDIDECQKFSLQICSSNSKCRNTQGSFMCVCNEGFQSTDEHSRSCRDIDECLQPHMCQHNCHNSWGSFHCSCQSGYKLGSDQRSCIDVDECSEWKGQGQLCVGICQNTLGSYACTCPRGYVLQGDRTCIDLNECDTGTANCNGPDDICINTRGSFRCETVTCPNGFVKTPSVNSKSNGYRYPIDSGYRSSSGNRIRSVLGRPPAVYSKDDSSVVCQKLQCRSGDIDCLLNETKSIQWQFVALPTLGYLNQPLTIVHVQTIGYSVYPNLEFTIVSGNEEGYFKTVKNSVRGDRAELQLLRAIDGPDTRIVKMRMDNRNSFGNLVSRHIAYVVVYVSQFDF